MHKMTLNRNGVIRVRKDQATNCQCVIEGQTTYYYKSVMTFLDPLLDKRGFLADHAEVDLLIVDFYKDRPVPSCELMVRELAEFVADWLKAQGMPAVSVFMQITNIPDGSQGYINTTYYPVVKPFKTH